VKIGSALRLVKFSSFLNLSLLCLLSSLEEKVGTETPYESLLTPS